MDDSTEKVHTRKLIRNFIIEVAVYAVLVFAYFFIVLRYLGLQSVVLDWVTSFLLDQIKLERFD
jgi:hypothetical protein